MHTIDKKVLFIVDDDEIFLKILQRHLQLKNAFEIHTFQSGEKCVAQLGMQPDIIILDYNLNRSGGSLNGQQTLEAIQRAGCQSKIVMLSGQEDGALVLELIQKGANDYVEKSMNALQELDDILVDYLK